MDWVAIGLIALAVIAGCVAVLLLRSIPYTPDEDD